MKTHILKTDPNVFSQSLLGFKPWEIRFNDRNFHVGDKLILKETQYSGKEMEEGAPLIYTKRELKTIINFTLFGNKYGLAKGWVIMTVSQI